MITFQVVSSLGGAPCHLTLDKTRKVLFATNYVNNLSAFQLDDEGKIGHEILNEAYGAGSNAVPDRQADAHPHGVYMYNDFVFVVDLGADKIWRYRITKATPNGKTQIEKVGSTDTPLGWGPRHMTIKNNTAYVIFELETRIGVYNIDPLSGELKFVAALPTVSAKSTFCLLRLPNTTEIKFLLHFSFQILMANLNMELKLQYIPMANGCMLVIEDMDLFLSIISMRMLTTSLLFIRYACVIKPQEKTLENPF